MFCCLLRCDLPHTPRASVHVQRLKDFCTRARGQQSPHGVLTLPCSSFHPTLASIPQVDIVIDETYAVDPTMYDHAAFLSNYSISAADAKTLSFLNGTAPQCAPWTAETPSSTPCWRHRHTTWNFSAYTM